MNENILLINVHSSRNLGDAALLQAAQQQLQDKFPGSQFTLCMDDPISHAGAGVALQSISAWVHPMEENGEPKWNYLRLAWLLPASCLPIWSWRLTGRAIYGLTPKSLRKILQAYLQADIVVSKPGGFLFSSGREISLLVALYSIILAIMAGKPVYILPQSIGPLRYYWTARIVSWVLRHARLVMVREPASMREMLTHGMMGENVRLVPDMAFTLPGADLLDGENWLRAQGIDPQDDQPRLGMTIFYWKGLNQRFARQDRYEQACVAAARWFVEHTGGRVFLFPQVWGPSPSQDDRYPARRVADQLDDLADSILVVEQPMGIEMLKAVYARMDVFIGTRLHSNIFALSEGVPVIAIGYQHKTLGVAEMIGVSQWVVDIEQVNEDNLVERLSALWKERQRWREHIQNSVPHLIVRARHAVDLIWDDHNQVVNKY